MIIAALANNKKKKERRIPRSTIKSVKLNKAYPHHDKVYIF